MEVARKGGCLLTSMRHGDASIQLDLCHCVIGLSVLIGFAAALLVGRLLSGMLFGVGATDPVSVTGAALVLSAIALLACYLPARWATRVDPLEALHEG